MQACTSCTNLGRLLPRERESSSKRPIRRPYPAPLFISSGCCLTLLLALPFLKLRPIVSSFYTPSLVPSLSVSPSRFFSLVRTCLCLLSLHAHSHLRLSCACACAYSRSGSCPSSGRRCLGVLLWRRDPRSSEGFDPLLLDQRMDESCLRRKGPRASGDHHVRCHVKVAKSHFLTYANRIPTTTTIRVSSVGLVKS